LLKAGRDLKLSLLWLGAWLLLWLDGAAAVL